MSAAMAVPKSTAVCDLHSKDLHELPLELIPQHVVELQCTIYFSSIIL